jgi:hypothetical protein
MMGMLWAPWPRRVRERVVHVLLDVVDDPLFEIGGVVAEQTHACRSLFHHGLVARADGALEILLNEADYAVFVSVRHAAGLFSNPPRLLARSTIRNTLPDYQMTITE